MDKYQSITSKELNDISYGQDLFKVGSVVLIQLNLLPDSYEDTDLIQNINCTIKKEYVVLEEKETFKKIIELGKRAFNIIKKNTQNINDLSIEIASNKTTKNEIIELYNDFIKENGYPYLSEQLPHMKDKPYCPDYIELIDESVTIYIVNELRKWIFKIRNEEENNTLSNGIISNLSKIKIIFSFIKQELISTTINSKDVVVYDHINKEQIVERLEHGLLEDDSTTLIKKDLLEFLQILQRTLIYFILNRTNSSIQYSVTKSLPIFNTTSDQYRLYPVAYSLMGIAYNYLLNNLTTSKISFERVICRYPGCNNEFEKEGKLQYCDEHKGENNRKFRNHTYYMKTKKNRGQKIN